MSCQCRYSHTYQDRSTGCCHDTVIGSGGYTHTKYDTAQHSQKQCNDQFSVCNTDDSVDQVIGKSCHGDGTGNDSCNTAGYCYGDNTSSSCFQRINTFGNTDSVFFVKKTYDNRKNDCIAGSLLHGHIVSGHPDYQHDQR